MSDTSIQPPVETLNGHAQRPAVVWPEELVLGRILGNGASGTVYEGTWDGRRVAVKKFLPTGDGSLPYDFEMEARMLCYLSHPNVCRMLGACSLPRYPAIVLEYVERGHLGSVLKKKKDLSLKLRVNMAMEIASAMAYLHSFERPILHRDLKSLNVLVDKNYSVKVADFGLARVEALDHVMTGNVGTYHWMAPEVIRGELYSKMADVYSFAVVLWELFTGEQPNSSVPQLIAAVVNGKCPRPHIPKSRIPMFIFCLIQECWAEEPQDRPTFQKVLDRCRKGIQDFNFPDPRTSPVEQDKTRVGGSSPTASAMKKSKSGDSASAGVKSSTHGSDGNNKVPIKRAKKGQAARRRCQKRQQWSTEEAALRAAELAQKKVRTDVRNENRKKNEEGVLAKMARQDLEIAEAHAAGRPAPEFKPKRHSNQNKDGQSAHRHDGNGDLGERHGGDGTDTADLAATEHLSLSDERPASPAAGATNLSDRPSWPSRFTGFA